MRSRFSRLRFWPGGVTEGASYQRMNNGILRIALGADHGGVEIKSAIIKALQEAGHKVVDYGTNDEQSVDYPDYAKLVSENVATGKADFGVLMCKTGIGMSIAANRMPGVRAARLCTTDDAKITRSHNDSNVACLGASDVSPEEAVVITKVFLAGEFAGGRHVQRVAKASGSHLEVSDPEVFAAVEAEGKRQQNHVELIASENFVSGAILEAQGSLLTNKYAEGYPGRRWYGGCEHVDVVEQLAIDRAKELFGAEHVNVQPHSGSQANAAVYFAFLKPGDKILTMDLAHGGHLTHGHKANFSGKFYEVTHYGVSEDDERIDYDQLERAAREVKPKLITCGASAYSRVVDYERMGKIAREVGAFLFVDMAHIAGLVAAGVHPSPVPHADFVTTTTHKSLRGPRGGLILCGEQYAKKINSMVFPGVQGGPLMHVIAAKAVCLGEALRPDFKGYQEQIVKNAQALAVRLGEHGYRIVSGGTDNHSMLVDMRPAGLDGTAADAALDAAGITVNKNAIPFDTGTPMKPSGIRVGTPAVTTRGMVEKDIVKVADLMDEAIQHRDDEGKLKEIRARVFAFNQAFPLLK